MPKCGRCGNSSTDEAAFCPFCGEPIDADGSLVEQPESGAKRLGDIVNRLFSDRVAEAEAVRLVAGRAAAALVPNRERGFRLIVVDRDGSDGTVYSLVGGQIDIGRTEGDLLFDDPHLARRHARISSGPDSRLLTALDGLNGVYVALRAPVALENGDRILVGKQVLQVDLVSALDIDLRPDVDHGVALFGTPTRAAWARLRQLTPATVTRDLFHLTREETVIGREEGDIVFSDDEFMSRRHARLSLLEGRPQLEDLGSSNGTFRRLRAPHPLAPGDLIRMGDAMLRFEEA